MNTEHNKIIDALNTNNEFKETDEIDIMNKNKLCNNNSQLAKKSIIQISEFMRNSLDEHHKRSIKEWHDLGLGDEMILYLDEFKNKITCKDDTEKT